MSLCWLSLDPKSYPNLGKIHKRSIWHGAILNHFYKIGVVNHLYFIHFYVKKKSFLLWFLNIIVTAQKRFTRHNSLYISLWIESSTFSFFMCLHKLGGLNHLNFNYFLYLCLSPQSRRQKKVLNYDSLMSSQELKNILLGVIVKVTMSEKWCNLKFSDRNYF